MFYDDAPEEMRFPRPLSVSELNNFIKQVFDTIPQLRDVGVQGEISNFKYHAATGHFYFSLKDETSVIRAVMFRSSAQKVRFRPENGMKVTVFGRVSVFPRDGQYQLYAESMEPLGKGALYVAYEQLKAKLSAEGLFDPSRKRPLPKFPRSVGVVTSPSGAAVRDVIDVITRRWKHAEICVCPCLVQGERAPKDIVRAIEFLNRTHRCDVIIAGRGGGSIEDLWAFNDERTVRAIAASEIPVISAVGHETDFTLSDFAADRRAPTPSAAAELAVPDETEIRHLVGSLYSALVSAEEHGLERRRQSLAKLSGAAVLKRHEAAFEIKKDRVAALRRRLEMAEKTVVGTKSALFASRTRMLDSLNPLSVLERGYSAVFSANEKLLKSIDNVEVGDSVTVRVSDGRIFAKVTGRERSTDGRKKRENEL